MDTMQFHPISEIFPSTPPAEFDALVPISAIVDARFSVIVDGISG